MSDYLYTVMVGDREYATYAIRDIAYGVAAVWAGGWVRVTPRAKAGGQP